MKQNYLIGVCDILGFSALVEGKSLDTVVDHSLALFRKSLNHSVLKSSFPEQVPATSDLNRHEHVGVAWFSDTLLFYSKSDTDIAIRELLATVSWLIFETMIQGHTKIRAGIAYGEAYIDSLNSMYVGKPIVEAYYLERIQQWSGGALSQSAFDRLPEAARSGKFADWWVTPYEVPLSNGQTRHSLALNWNMGIHHPDWRLRWSKESELPSELDWLRDSSICEKFVNTKKFHEANCKYCNLSNRT